MKLIKDPKTGTWKIRIWTEHGQKTLTTKCQNRDDAVSVLNQSGLKQAELAARAGQLTSQAISKILTGRKITLADAMEAWLERLGCRGRSARTVHNYRIFVNSFVKEHRHRMPSTITENHVEAWVNNPRMTQKAGSRMVRLTAIRSFMEYCQDKGWCAGNPANLVEVNYALMTHQQKEPKQRLPFTDEEISTLLCHTKDNPFWHPAIILGRYVGLRLGDIASLEWACLEKNRIVVWTDKHDRRVELPLEPEPLAALVERLLERMEMIGTTPYVFPDQHWIAIDPTRRAILSTQFSRLCQSAGIEGKSFHSLRHSFACDCQRRGHPIWYISQSLGHRNAQTTALYLH